MTIKAAVISYAILSLPRPLVAGVGLGGLLNQLTVACGGGCCCWYLHAVAVAAADVAAFVAGNTPPLLQDPLGVPQRHTRKGRCS